MGAKRQNPVAGIIERIRAGAAKVDSTMRAYTGKDFEQMHKRPKPKPKESK